MFIINDKRFFIQNSFKSIAHTFLKLKIEKDYFGADIVFSEIKTEYGYNNYFDINKMTVSSSTGVNKVFTLKYSGDLNSKLGTNMVSLPVQQETLLGNKVIDGNIFTRLLNGNINQIYKYRGNKPELPLNFLNYNSIPNGYINDKKFIYYTNGVLKSIESLFYPSITYLWGYGGQYPIAEIKNATYAEVEAVLTQTTINNLNSPNVLEATITTAMNKLRTDTRLAKAMVTSYTYQPLVGMRSKTDTRGVTEFYEYDGMQRLKAILDHVKNVTSAMDYHYRPN